jgi:hypothetical protein
MLTVLEIKANPVKLSDLSKEQNFLKRIDKKPPRKYRRGLTFI